MKTLYHIKIKERMKLNINIFRRKQREEAYKDKYLNGRKPEGTAHKAVYISREKTERPYPAILTVSSPNTLNATVRSWRTCTGRKATMPSDR